MSKATSPKKRAAAIEYYRTHTASDTGAAFGVEKSTISRWAKAAGVDKIADVRAQTAAATEAHVLTAKAKRAQAREDLATAAAKIAKFIADLSLTEALPEHAVPPKELWQYATTIEVLTKVIRLEEGESTGRQEVSHEYPDIAALSDDELEAAIVREAEGITRGEAEA